MSNKFSKSNQQPAYPDVCISKRKPPTPPSPPPPQSCAVHPASQSQSAFVGSANWITLAWNPDTSPNPSVTTAVTGPRAVTENTATVNAPSFTGAYSIGPPGVTGTEVYTFLFTWPDARTCSKTVTVIWT